MQEIITLVLSKGDPTIAQTQPNWARAPWLEQYYSPDVLNASKGPRVITTHLPYRLLAPALKQSKAKVSRWASRKLLYLDGISFPREICVSHVYLIPSQSAMSVFFFSHNLSKKIQRKLPIVFLANSIILCEN